MYCQIIAGLVLLSQVTYSQTSNYSSGFQPSVKKDLSSRFKASTSESNKPNAENNKQAKPETISDKDDVCPWDGKDINDLHKLAQAETGKHNRPFTSFEGGDMTDARDFFRVEFMKRFPGIEAILKVNYSNQHDVFIYQQLASSGELDFDVAHLQSVHDFPKWKEGGHLISFKPPGFENVIDDVKDPDGYFVANEMITFAPIVRVDDFKNGKFPLEDADFLKPEYKNKLVMTFPNHDDAVLYRFHKFKLNGIENYIQKLLKQNMTWVKCTETVNKMVQNQTFQATLTGGKDFSDQAKILVTNYDVQVNDKKEIETVMVLPKKSHFLTWGQTIGIFKRGKYPCTAKLYVAWSLSKEYQDLWGMFSVFKDREAPYVGSLSKYENTSPKEFKDFMNNRPKVDHFREEITKLIGEPMGMDPFDDPNLSGKVDSMPTPPANQMQPPKKEYFDSLKTPNDTSADSLQLPNQPPKDYLQPIKEPSSGSPQSNKKPSTETIQSPEESYENTSKPPTEQSANNPQTPKESNADPLQNSPNSPSPEILPPFVQ